MPAAAQADLLRWTSKDLRQVYSLIFAEEIDMSRLVSPDPRMVVTDDRPFNEYSLLRRRRLTVF